MSSLNGTVLWTRFFGKFQTFISFNSIHKNAMWTHHTIKIHNVNFVSSVNPSALAVIVLPDWFLLEACTFYLLYTQATERTVIDSVHCSFIYTVSC